MKKLMAWWKRRKRWQKILTVIGVLFVIGGIASGIGESESSTETAANSAETSPATTPPTTTSPATPTPASPTASPTEPSTTESPAAPPTESPTEAASEPAGEDKIAAAVRGECPTGTEGSAALSPAACTDVTGYEYHQVSLQVNTKLFDKDENKEFAQEIANLVLAATDCGRKTGTPWRFLDDAASNGRFLVSGFSPPTCRS